MKAVLLRRTGPPNVLRWEDVPDPEPGPGEVRVRVEALGLNYAEVLSRKGLYGWVRKRPYIPGMEAVGVLDAVGPGVDRHVGERVLVGTQYGAYAERVVVPAAQALPTLPGLTVEQEAAFPVNYLTAWVGLMTLGRAAPGERVSISPAAGGVGTAAVQLASARGCRILAMAGSWDKLDRVRELGAGETLCYREPGFRDALAASTREQGLDVALEMVGGPVFQAVRDAMAPFGRVVVAGYAALDYRWWNPLSVWRAWRGVPRVPLSLQSRRSLGFYATHLGYLLEDPDRLLQDWRDLVDYAETHEIRPVVGATLPAARIAEAHRLMESRESYGKIVLMM